METIQLLLLLSCAGHLALWRCDWMLTRLDGGRFDFRALKDNAGLSALFGRTEARRPLRSAVAGVIALAAILPGYLALCGWMDGFSAPCAALMRAGCALYFTAGAAHHALCGTAEWLYIRMDRSDEARQMVTELFQKTAGTMYACYTGLLLFAAALFAAVIAGWTSLPRWACVVNTLPLFLALLPLRPVGAGNLAGAAMALGLGLLI